MSSTDATQENTVAQKSMEVVLNGGSDVMESATIPFRWFFSDAVIEQQPTHIFAVDLTEKQTHGLWAECSGERFVTNIERGSDFIQFHSPGHHKLVFIAMRAETREVATNAIYEFLRLERRGIYSYPVYFNDVKAGAVGTIPRMGYSVAVCTAEVHVPEEFFALKDKTPFQAWRWKWVNRWYEAPPRDECQFRNRMIWAFTVQPVLFGLCKLLQFGVYAPVISLFVILARLSVFLFGFRPEPIFSGLGQIWEQEFDPNIDVDIRKWGEGSYGVWVPEYESPSYKTQYMPTTGLELLCWAMFAAAGLFSLKFLLQMEGWAGIGKAIAWGIMSALLLLGLLAATKERVRDRAWYKSLREKLNNLKGRWVATRIVRREAQKKAEQSSVPPKPKAELYFEWLREEMHISRKPGRLDVKTLPQAFRGRNVQKFRVAFWDMKRRICHPFAKS